MVIDDLYRTFVYGCSLDVAKSRIKILRDLGYETCMMHVPSQVHGFKRINRPPHLHYKYNDKEWGDFYVATCHGIFNITDEEFDEQIKSLPEKEKIAWQNFDEWQELALYNKSLIDGTDIIENQNQADDKQKLDGLVKHIHAMIEANNFKSLKYTNIFSHVLAELDKLK